MNGLGGRNEPQITGREDIGCCVSPSPSYQYSKKKAPEGSLEWTSKRHSHCWGGLGIRAGLQTCQNSLRSTGLSISTSRPCESTFPSLGIHPGLPPSMVLSRTFTWLAAFLGRKDSSTQNISQLQMTVHLLSSLLGGNHCVQMETQLAGCYLTKSVGVPLGERCSMTKEGQEMTRWLPPSYNNW